MSTLRNSTYFCVIMPFGRDAHTETKQAIFTTVASEQGIAVRFPLHFKDAPTFDLQSTVENFKHAQFIIADLSFERPSCYYELGIAETLGTTVYVIATQGTDIHQTSNRQAVQYYEDLYNFEALIRSIIRQAQAG